MRREPCIRNRVAAITADAVGAFVDSAERLFDGLENLCVGLLQFELDMHLVGAAGLVGHVTLPPRVVLHRPLKRLGGRPAQQLATLLQQLRAISFDFHEYYSQNGPKLARTNHDLNVSGRAWRDPRSRSQGRRGRHLTSATAEGRPLLVSHWRERVC